LAVFKLVISSVDQGVVEDSKQQLELTRAAGGRNSGEANVGPFLLPHTKKNDRTWQPHTRGSTGFSLDNQ
jgi:hypothetical protein